MAKIRIVIVAYHSLNDLKRCLPTIPADSDLEICIVDNSSCENTENFLKSEYPQIIYINPEDNLGFARANNLGSKGFNGDYLCFLNPDTEIEPGAIQKLAEFLDARPDAAAAGPLVKNSDMSRQMSYRRWPGFSTSLFHRYSLITKLFPNNPWSKAYLMSDDDGMAAKKVDWLSGCCMLVRNSAFQKIGGFDERYFMFCEDTAICKTFELNNFERWFFPDAKIVHHIGKSISEKSVKLVFERHRSMWIYFKTFNRHWLLLSPFTIAGLIVRFSIYGIKAFLNSRKNTDA